MPSNGAVSSGCTDDQIFEAVKGLLHDYYSFNPNSVEELYEEPTPLEFMRFVSRNRPVVIRKGATSWRACELWDAHYLAEKLGETAVNVAMTMKGNADSPVKKENGQIWFVKPFERELPFERVLEYITKQEMEEESSGPILYAQTQNDNIRGEYEALFADIPKSIPFARIALEKEPDAINFWLGNSKSTTALHKDPYENIYVQIRGCKHFTLLPPHAAACINDTALQAATYEPQNNDKSIPDMLIERLDQPAATVPFPTWDPDEPDQQATPFSSLARPLRITLEPGDMLYLPALWFHKVGQSCGEEGFCCAVNYWFDMEYSGSFFPLCAFTREVGKVATSVPQTSKSM